MDEYVGHYPGFGPMPEPPRPDHGHRLLEVAAWVLAIGVAVLMAVAVSSLAEEFSGGFSPGW